MQAPSIFNDVIGPVMVGPSSSHTAAGVRIANWLRALAEGQPQMVQFNFSRSGSLAPTYHSNCFDLGLATGLLGWEADDSRLPQALEHLAAAGIDMSFVITEEEFPHPNLCDVTMRSAKRVVRAQLTSIGGGMIELVALNGIPLQLSGGSHYALAFNCPGYFATEAASCYPDIEFTEHGVLLVARGFAPLPTALKDALAPYAPLYLEPVLPIADRPDNDGLWSSAAELMEAARLNDCDLAKLAACYEAQRGGITVDEVEQRMMELVRLWRRTLTQAAQPMDYPNRLLGQQACLLDTQQAVSGQPLAAMLRNVTLLMEAKSAMLPIIAAPTAGSCGCLPGSVLALADQLGLDDRAVARAILAAGLLGVIIVSHGTFAAEVAGCQAECGHASGMTAAALVQLKGGTVEQALNAASLALQNVFGWTCDPVAKMVEAPCLGKNIMAASNALTATDMALAGFDPLIPLDEVIVALDEAGRMLPAELRCTGGAGLSRTKASIALGERLGIEM